MAGGASGVAADERYVYLAAGNAGLRVLDASDPARTQVTGGLAGDVEAFEVIPSQGIQQELLGCGVPGNGIGESVARFEQLPIWEEQTKIGLLLTEIDPDLQTVAHSIRLM